MKKIIVSDYDGTFTSDLYHNIEAVNNFRDENHLFIIATGRNYSEIIDDLNQFNVTYDYLICDHGAVIFDHKNHVIDKITIMNKLINPIKRFLKNGKNYKNINFYNELGKSIHFNNIVKIQVEPLNIKLADAQRLNIERSFSQIHGFIIHHKLEFIDIKASKENAIRKIMEIQSIDESDVYTIGDSSNDLSMIKAFNGSCLTNNDLVDHTCKNYDSVADLIEYVNKRE